MSVKFLWTIILSMTLLTTCEALAIRLAFINLGLLFRLCILLWNLFFLLSLLCRRRRTLFHYMHTLLLANNPLCRLEFLKVLCQRIGSFTHCVIKAEILKGLRERHKHDIDLGFSIISATNISSLLR